MIPLIIGGVTLVVGYVICEDGCDIFSSRSNRKHSSNNENNYSNDLIQYKQFQTLKVGIYATTFKEFNTLLSQIKNTEFEKLVYDAPSFQTTSLTQDLDSDTSKEPLQIIEDLEKSLSDLNTLFNTYNKKLGYVVIHSDDYASYNESDTEIVKTTLRLAKMIDRVCHLDVLSKDTEMSKKSQKILRKAKELVGKFDSK